MFLQCQVTPTEKQYQFKHYIWLAVSSSLGHQTTYVHCEPKKYATLFAFQGRPELQSKTKWQIFMAHGVQHCSTVVCYSNFLMSKRLTSHFFY